MSSIEQIKTTIRSTQKTRKITSTMKSVALSKLNKARKASAATLPYAQKMLQVIGHIAQSHSEYLHPFMQRRDQVKRLGIIIVSSDRGLCGPLNAQLFRHVLEAIKQHQQKGVAISLALFGNKAISFFGQLEGIEVIASANHLGDKPNVMDTIGVVQAMLDQYHKGDIDRIMLSYNQFESMVSQKPQILNLLPIVALEPLQDSQSLPWDYIYEPSAQVVLDQLLNRYIESLVYQAVIDNIACEQAARMMAMESATNNADELIGDLKLMYNKARQAAITKELAEIVGGADAVT